MYGVQLFDDIHNYLPDILYNPSRFRNVQDLLQYIITSAQLVTPYNRGLREYRTLINQPINVNRDIHNNVTNTNNVTNVTNTTNTPTNVSPVTATRVRTSIPILTTVVDTNEMSDNITNIFTQLLGDQFMRGFLDQSVVVRPTEQEINRATTEETIQTTTEDNCAICQDVIENGAVIRKINHCGHIFHKECIDAWFDRNVRCPTCRHDIR
jgi:hypothetical protein